MPQALPRPLQPPGLPPPRSWENKDIYAAAIRSLRLRELQNTECVSAVRAGLGAIIPLQLLTALSPRELELRTCGLPSIDLEFLKVPLLPPPCWDRWVAVAGPACEASGATQGDSTGHGQASAGLVLTSLSRGRGPGFLASPWELTSDPPSPGPHHVPGGADGDGPAHRVLLGRPGDVHPGGTLQVHQICLQSGAHPFHLPLQRWGPRHCPRAPVPHEDRTPRWHSRYPLPEHRPCFKRKGEDAHTCLLSREASKGSCGIQSSLSWCLRSDR